MLTGKVLLICRQTWQHMFNNLRQCRKKLYRLKILAKPDVTKEGLGVKNKIKLPETCHEQLIESTIPDRGCA